MTINELTNEEVLFLYFANQDYVAMVQDIIEHRSTYQEIDLAGITKISIEKTLDDKELSELESSVYYKNALAIEEKFEPIVQLIKEADPGLYEVYYNNKENLNK
jgi:hypothetical protein